MPFMVNALGMLTAALCAVLLFRGYAQVRRRLLLWCAISFSGLTVANGVLILDLWVIADVSLYRARLMFTVVSMFVLLYGLIFESDQS
jgi:Family of unknown function (DUF5985)